MTTYLQNVDSMPTYSPRSPSFLIIVFTTSIGPLNVLALSCSLSHALSAQPQHRYSRDSRTHLILTSSNGTTTKLSVAPALDPVRIASSCVIFFCPVSFRYVLPHQSLAALQSR